MTESLVMCRYQIFLLAWPYCLHIFLMSKIPKFSKFLTYYQHHCGNPGFSIRRTRYKVYGKSDWFLNTVPTAIVSPPFVSYFWAPKRKHQEEGGFFIIRVKNKWKHLQLEYILVIIYICVQFNIIIVGLFWKSVVDSRWIMMKGIWLSSSSQDRVLRPRGKLQTKFLSIRIIRIAHDFSSTDPDWSGLAQHGGSG